VALLNKVIFYILKCTVLNLNNISTKDLLEDIKFILCSETNALFNTAKFHDSLWCSSTELEKLE
jgi:hypothetical protein